MKFDKGLEAEYNFREVKYNMEGEMKGMRRNV